MPTGSGASSATSAGCSCRATLRSATGWRRPATDDMVRLEDARVAGSGSLRTYLGIAPGVGKTFAMLAEGRHRAETGERVMVGWLESHDRPETSRQAGGLEVLAPRTVAYRGAAFADFDA